MKCLFLKNKNEKLEITNNEEEEGKGHLKEWLNLWSSWDVVVTLFEISKKKKRYNYLIKIYLFLILTILFLFKKIILHRDSTSIKNIASILA